MYFTGFADEAARDLAGQIRATKELGWKFIESRAIDGVNIHDLPQDKFDLVANTLDKEGIKVNCFGSTIANWAKKITDPFDSSLAEAERAIPRMKRLGTKLIRIMSFARLDDREPNDQMQDERFRRLRILTKMFLDNGIQPVHENCMNYGGMGWPFTLKLLDEVPGLKLVFDTGNPISTLDKSKPKPYPYESSWEFYDHVKDHIVYVHIKDGIRNPEDGKMTYTWAGDGQGDVRKIVTDLLKNGYDGGFSMEPHMQVVFHEESKQEDKTKAMYDNYVEYGRRFEKLVEECRRSIKA
ncbi:MAG: sugar phosphate isomerase/epimerase [Lentisphaerae bacterium]|jgi:sugar phosphate isomerase/epimerase|nr:sugar phosphate isomerase/epimerase [Lentisphaerota bacterium]